MIHLPGHVHAGSLCSIDIAPTPGLLPFPHPDSRPADAGDDLCPECRRAHAALVQAWNRAARRVAHCAALGLPIPPGNGDPARFA